jgi:carboxynorspermidine decarboxylase
VGLARLVAAALGDAPSPCFVVGEELLGRNLALLSAVKERTGCGILLALKGFAMFSLFQQIREPLDGVCASGLNEARLGREEFGKKVHVFSPAYSDDDFREIITLADTVVFNSLAQRDRLLPLAEGMRRRVRFGLRVNPGHSEISVPLYDPCAPCSRLGILAADLSAREISGISGLHFHALCEQNADTLGRVLAAFEERFDHLLPSMGWVNFGGGHHITRDDYDIDLLCRLITSFRQRHHGIDVYLEPGEAVALNTGILVATVLDIVRNGMEIAILDTSAETHMPDVLAMPYRPEIWGAGTPGEHPHTYRLGGNSCLGGDVIGDYSFPEPLKVGTRLAFLDMAHYSMVKTTTFNGVNLPSIAICGKNGEIRVVRRFGYEDYKARLS